MYSYSYEPDNKYTSGRRNRDFSEDTRWALYMTPRLRKGLNYCVRDDSLTIRRVSFNLKWPAERSPLCVRFPLADLLRWCAQARLRGVALTFRLGHDVML